MRKSRAHTSQFSILLFTSLFLLAWILATFGKVHYGRDLFWKGVGSAFGVLGYFLFSLSLLLSSRWKRLEDWFGGLDRVYHLHHQVGVWGFCFILAHPWFHGIKWLPQNTERFFQVILPIHHRFSVNLGVYTYYFMIQIIGVTLLKLLPYDKWKLMHRFMSVVFVLASLHFLLSQQRFGPLFLLWIPLAIGLFGIVYKQIWKPLFSHHSEYRVSSIKRITSNVLRITLQCKQHPILLAPGQYAFFSFKTFSHEQHPFTVCAQEEDKIEILAKARGDFTRNLYEKLQEAEKVYLDGPYGRFDFREGGNEQVWIAGGIGIAPFIAWSQLLKEWKGKATLYYCFHKEEDFAFAKTFRSIENERFKIYTFCSDKGERLTTEAILKNEGSLQRKDIFMCGPRRLTFSFAANFKKHGIKDKNIHFENFEFF